MGRRKQSGRSGADLRRGRTQWPPEPRARSWPPAPGRRAACCSAPPSSRPTLPRPAGMCAHVGARAELMQAPALPQRPFTGSLLCQHCKVFYRQACCRITSAPGDIFCTWTSHLSAAAQEAGSSRPAEARTMQQAELERCLKRYAAPAGSAAEHLMVAEVHQPRRLQASQLPGPPLLLVSPLPPQRMQQRQPCPVLEGLLQARLSALRLRLALQAGFCLLQVLMEGLLVAVQRPAKPPRCHLAPCQLLQLQ